MLQRLHPEDGCEGERQGEDPDPACAVTAKHHGAVRITGLILHQGVPAEIPSQPRPDREECNRHDVEHLGIEEYRLG